MLLSCSSSDETYLNRAIALGSASPCDRIAAAPLQTECRLAVAQSLASTHLDEAIAVCTSVPTEVWKDECVFLSIDEAGVVGEEAMAQCAVAGQYRQQCITHAAARDVERQVFAAATPGQERQAHERAEGVLRQYMSGGDARRMARTLVISWLATREPGQPFSARSCGNLRPEMCPEVYVRRAQGDGMRPPDDAPWRALCGAPLDSAEQAVRHGLPRWDASGAAMAAEGWQRLCQPRLQ